MATSRSVYVGQPAGGPAFFQPAPQSVGRAPGQIVSVRGSYGQPPPERQQPNPVYAGSGCPGFCTIL